MKKLLLLPAFILMSICILSCSSSDNDSPETPEAKDDYKLLTVTDGGELFHIGNNSGNVENIGKIKKEAESSLLAGSNFVLSEKNIYGVEYLSDPIPTNNLLIYHRQTDSTTIIPLQLPLNLSGSEPAILALLKDGNQLLGIIGENISIPHTPKHMISIDLETYQTKKVTDLSFNEEPITSMLKIGSSIYMSTWGEGLIKMDLDSQTMDRWDNVHGSRMAWHNNGQVAMMRALPDSYGAAQPALWEVNSGTVMDLPTSSTYGIVTVMGNSIIKDGIYLNLVSSNASQLYFGILKTDLAQRRTSVTKIHSTNINRNMIILGTVQ